MSLPRDLRSRIYREAAIASRRDAAITMQRLIRRRQAMLAYFSRMRILNRAVGGSSARARRLMMLTRHGNYGRYNYGR